MYYVYACRFFVMHVTYNKVHYILRICSCTPLRIHVANNMECKIPIHVVCIAMYVRTTLWYEYTLIGNIMFLGKMSVQACSEYHCAVCRTSTV